MELSTHAWRIKLIGAVTALLIYKLSTYNFSFSRFAESKCSSMWEFAKSLNKIKIIIIFVFNKIAAYNFHVVFIQLQIEMFCCAQSTHILILFDDVNFINMFSMEKEAWLYIFSSIEIWENVNSFCLSFNAYHVQIIEMYNCFLALKFIFLSLQMKSSRCWIYGMIRLVRCVLLPLYKNSKILIFSSFQKWWPGNFSIFSKVMGRRYKYTVNHLKKSVFFIFLIFFWILYRLVPSGTNAPSVLF